VKKDYMNISKSLILNIGREGQGLDKTGHLELENQRSFIGPVGSNPTLSAIFKWLLNTTRNQLE
jgi:hypothetical protein